MTMVLRYAHLSPGYVAGYASNASLDDTSDHNSGHSVSDVSENYQGDNGNLGWLNGLEPSTTGITIQGSTN